MNALSSPWLKAYALISHGVRLMCSHQSGKGARQTVLHTQGRGGMKDNIVTVFGAKMISALTAVDLNLEGGCGCNMSGFVSKAAPGWGGARLTQA